MASKHLFGTPITNDSSTAKEQLGVVRREYDTTNGWRTFKYVQASLLASAANGTCLLWYDAIGTVVTDDISTTSQNLPAGVATGTLTHSYYGWIQIGGYHSNILTDGTAITDGETIIYDTGDGVCDAVAVGTAPTHKPLGICVASTSAAITQGLLDCTYGDIV